MAGINFRAFDLGGHEIARKVWKDYYAKVCVHLASWQQRLGDGDAGVMCWSWKGMGG